MISDKWTRIKNRLKRIQWEYRPLQPIPRLEIRDPLVILGNGPSLANINFHDLSRFHTFGFNAAYRQFERLDWWPTYIGSFDYNVCAHHREAYHQLLFQEIPNRVKHFFFCTAILPLPDLPLENVTVTAGYRETRKEYPKDVSLPISVKNYHFAGNSGAVALELGMCLGYRSFILLGVDCNYTETYESADVKGDTVTLLDDPSKNNNYWFNDYQRAGDVFTIPNADIAHIQKWNEVAHYAAAQGVIILNCSGISRLDCFKKCSLEAAIRQLQVSR